MHKKAKKRHILFSGGLAATLFFSGTGSAYAQTILQSERTIQNSKTHISIRPTYDTDLFIDDGSSTLEATDIQEDLSAGSVNKEALLEQGFTTSQVRKIFQSAPKFL